VVTVFGDAKMTTACLSASPHHGDTLETGNAPCLFKLHKKLA
jgi:hypothetical protein